MAHPIFEGHQFIREITCTTQSSGVSLDNIWERALTSDAELRDAFHASPQHHTFVTPLAGLINPFNAPEALRRARSRLVDPQSELDPAARYIMCLSPDDRRPEGSPCLIDTIEEFKRNWNVYSEGLFAQNFDWANMVVAGNCVQGCMTPLPKEVLASNTTFCHFYHEEKYPSGVINIYLYGLTEEQAKVKIRQIYASIQLALPVNIRCVKSNGFLTFYSQYPFRPVQIALCIYQSQVDIVTSLDIDCEAALFDGHQVYMCARAIMAAMQQRNTIDMSRRSPSYENKLIHYGLQSFEIYVPNLQRENIDPGLFCLSLKQTRGLGRLLVSERLHENTQGKAILNGRVDLLDNRMLYGPGWTYECTIQLVEGRASTNASAGSLNDVLPNITFHVRQGQLPVARLDHTELGLWSKHVYLDADAAFFSAIATHNLSAVRIFLNRECFDPNQYDDQAKSPLHLSILVRAEDIAILLIEHGIKISSQLRDGRNALHLASQFDLPGIVEKLLKRSNTNKSADARNAGGSPEDVLQIDLEDNEHLTALSHAIFSGSTQSIKLLLNAGARLDLVKLGPQTQIFQVELQHSEPSGQVESAVVDVRRKRGWLLAPKSDTITADRSSIGVQTSLWE